MKVFLINLDHRIDRLVEMSDRMNRLELSFERISAFDGKRRFIFWRVAWFKAFIYAKLYLPTRGQVGCYYSHRLVWQKMIDYNIDHALVLEDDAIPINWDPAILTINLNELGLDQLRLEGLDRKIDSYWINASDILPKSYKVLDRMATNELSYGTAAYVVSLQGAKKFHSVGRFWFAVDHFYMWACMAGVRTAVLKPVMWKQSDSASNIDLSEGEMLKPKGQFGEVMWRIRRPLIRLIVWFLANNMKRRIERANRKHGLSKLI